MLGSLATFGYAAKHLDVEEELPSIWVVNPSALLIDTRLTPWCSWSVLWQRPNLEARYGPRYVWRGDWLGNIHHQTGGPVQLAHEEAGISWLVGHLHKGFTLLLLCGCVSYEQCHRKVIYDKVRARLPLPEYTLGQRVQTPHGTGRINPYIPLDVQRARNCYTVLLDNYHPRNNFYPDELEPADYVQQSLIV